MGVNDNTGPTRLEVHFETEVQHIWYKNVSKMDQIKLNFCIIR